MDRRNIEGFENAHPGKTFPLFRELTTNEMRVIQTKLKNQLALPAETDNLTVVRELAAVAEACRGIDAGSEDFRLRRCLAELGIKPEKKVCINHYRFDQIDELWFEDVDRVFEYIWYPGSDDIDIFDSRLNWVLSVSHDGEVSIVRF